VAVQIQALDSTALSYLVLLPHLDLIVLLLQVMKRFASKLLPGASSKAVRKAEARPDQSTTILDDAIVVFQRLIDLGSSTFNVLELAVAGQIGVQIVEIVKVRWKTPVV
jgi:hypothetical protein